MLFPVTVSTSITVTLADIKQYVFTVTGSDGEVKVFSYTGNEPEAVIIADLHRQLQVLSPTSHFAQSFLLNEDGSHNVTASAGGTGAATVEEEVTVVLTSADLKALVSTPVEILAAPGAGKAVLPTLITIEYVAGDTVYTIAVNATADLKLGTLTLATLPETGFFDQATDQVDVQTASLKGATVQVDNAALMLTASDELTDGTGTAKVTVRYRTITL